MFFIFSPFYFLFYNDDDNNNKTTIFLNKYIFNDYNMFGIFLNKYLGYIEKLIEIN